MVAQAGPNPIGRREPAWSPCRAGCTCLATPYGPTRLGLLSAGTLDKAMERLRKNFYPLWKMLVEAREDPTLTEE